MTMIALQLLLTLLSFAPMLLSLRAVLKGSDYIAASNFSWSDRTLHNVFREHKFQRHLLKLTPLALLITFTGAGCSTIYVLTWFLGEAGFYNRETGEWETYRLLLTSVIGGPLGIAFCSHYVRMCEKKLLNEITSIESPQEQLAILVGLGDELDN